MAGIFSPLAAARSAQQTESQDLSFWREKISEEEEARRLPHNKPDNRRCFRRAPRGRGGSRPARHYDVNVQSNEVFRCIRQPREVRIPEFEPDVLTFDGLQAILDHG